MPIKMYCRQTVFPFVSDPSLSAFLLILTLISQSVFKKDLVDLVVRDMDTMLEFDDLFETPCTQFLLFVGFKYKLNRFFV